VDCSNAAISTLTLASRARFGCYIEEPAKADAEYNVAKVIKSISQARAEFSALVEAVSRGKQVIIFKAGKPVAKLFPYGGLTGQRRPGALRGKIKIAADFDALPAEMQIDEPPLRKPI
jgi:prevent-host-death family protein